MQRKYSELSIYASNAATMCTARNYYDSSLQRENNFQATESTSDDTLKELTHHRPQAGIWLCQLHPHLQPMHPLRLRNALDIRTRQKLSQARNRIPLRLQFLCRATLQCRQAQRHGQFRPAQHLF